MELAPHGVRVNSISPGVVPTPSFLGGSDAVKTMGADEVDAKPAEMTRFFSRTTPLYRAGLPSEIASAAVFLASDDASSINCHDLVVDGGMTAGGRNEFEQTAFEATADRLRQRLNE